jgi:hypothetical protein
MLFQKQDAQLPYERVWRRLKTPSMNIYVCAALETPRRKNTRTSMMFSKPASRSSCASLAALKTKRVKEHICAVLEIDGHDDLSLHDGIRKISCAGLGIVKDIAQEDMCGALSWGGWIRIHHCIGYVAPKTSTDRSMCDSGLRRCSKPLLSPLMRKKSVRVKEGLRYDAMPVQKICWLESMEYLMHEDFQTILIRCYGCLPFLREDDQNPTQKPLWRFKNWVVQNAMWRLDWLFKVDSRSRACALSGRRRLIFPTQLLLF